MYPNMISMASLVRVLFIAFFLLICMQATTARIQKNSEKGGEYDIVEKAPTQARRPQASPVLSGNYKFAYSPSGHTALLKKKHMKGTYTPVSLNYRGKQGVANSRDHSVETADYYTPRTKPPSPNV